MIDIVNDSFLESKDKYLCLQMSCVGTKPNGLLMDTFNKYPFSNCYFNRSEVPELGTISIFGNGLDKRFVVGLNAQYYPGKPKYADSQIDGYGCRELYFHKCLLSLSKVKNLESVAFPFEIGCGKLKGNWDYYLGTIINFHNFVNNKFGTNVTIYRGI